MTGVVERYSFGECKDCPGIHSRMCCKARTDGDTVAAHHPDVTEMAGRIRAAFGKLSDADRLRISRELSGEATKDRLTRGAVYEVIRDLRVSPASLASSDYQRALRDVRIAVSMITTALGDRA